MSDARAYDVIVIGAGLAGLAAALHARNKGNRVLVIEKNERPGGKIEETKSGDFRFDMGPSLFTEPQLVDELFEMFGKNPRSYFRYNQYSESCRYFFQDGSKIILDNESLEKDKQLDVLSSYVDQAHNDKKYIGDFFLNNKQASIKDYFKWPFIRRYPYFLSKRFRKSLAEYNASSVRNNKLEMILNRFGTYNGSNPYQMSGLYSMISSLELKDGTYFPVGGMRSVINALFQLAQEEDVKFLFNTDVRIRKDGKSYLVKDSNDYHADKLICAIDHLAFYQKVLEDQELFDKYERQERSSSGLVFYWGVNKNIPGIGLHNILFSSDYKNEFKQIFNERTLPAEPTLYIHDSSVSEKEDAPENGHNLFIMINTPSYTEPDENYRNEMKAYILKKIKQVYGVDISDSIVIEDFLDNKTIEARTGSYLGALYGASSNKHMDALHRHPNQVKKHKNLYFCGGTVHPGGGIPLVLRSAKIVGEQL